MIDFEISNGSGDDDEKKKMMIRNDEDYVVHLYMGEPVQDSTSFHPQIITKISLSGRLFGEMVRGVFEDEGKGGDDDEDDEEDGEDGERRRRRGDGIANQMREWEEYMKKSLSLHNIPTATTPSSGDDQDNHLLSLSSLSTLPPPLKVYLCPLISLLITSHLVHTHSTISLPRSSLSMSMVSTISDNPSFSFPPSIQQYMGEGVIPLFMRGNSANCDKNSECDVKDEKEKKKDEEKIRASVDQISSFTVHSHHFEGRG